MTRRHGGVLPSVCVPDQLCPALEIGRSCPASVNGTCAFVLVLLLAIHSSDAVFFFPMHRTDSRIDTTALDRKFFHSFRHIKFFDTCMKY